MDPVKRNRLGIPAPAKFSGLFPPKNEPELIILFYWPGTYVGNGGWPHCSVLIDDMYYSLYPSSFESTGNDLKSALKDVTNGLPATGRWEELRNDLFGHTTPKIKFIKGSSTKSINQLSFVVKKPSIPAPKWTTKHSCAGLVASKLNGVGYKYFSPDNSATTPDQVWNVAQRKDSTGGLLSGGAW